MEVAHIENRVIDLVARELKAKKDKILLDTDFREDLDADSLDTTSLLMRIEEQFNVQLTDEEWHGLRTVRDIVAYVSRRH